MSSARLREVLNAGHTSKEKGAPVADGILSVTVDAPEVHELRSRRTAIDCVSTSSTYLEEDHDRPKPSDLYGKFTWKIERFSETSKRELRSNVFEVGHYKWYILVYPQGCDVCNHLSLFLCVADHEKLLPGWCHFAQFTIAVVNKDPKKSKYSDTLHRFCKKEHDWGWKKFMELGKILEGFTVNDTLVIKAQIQVIKDSVDRPFRCLDPQYRQELVRVYLGNVESLCRRFIDQSRETLNWLRTDAEAFKSFWTSLTMDMKQSIILESEDVILKGLVKRFFNEKEVTSTLVMDAIFCGCKQVEENSHLRIEGNRNLSERPPVLIDSKDGIFFLARDILRVIEAAANENIILSGKDLKDVDSTNSRSSQCDDSIKDSIVRDEHRLAELGRKFLEMFVISHIFTERIEKAYKEAECLKRQEELLREEEEAEKLKESRQKLKAQSKKKKTSKRKEKKKEQREAERLKKASEEAERGRKEQERKEEAEKKKQEEKKQRRLLEEKLEEEHQRALEEARQRAEKEELLKQQECLHEPTENTKEHTTTKKTTSVKEMERNLRISESEITGGESSTVVETSSCSLDVVRTEDEIHFLNEKVKTLERNLHEKELLIVRLEKELDLSRMKEKELETEVKKNGWLLPIRPRTLSKATQTSSSSCSRQETIMSPSTTTKSHSVSNSESTTIMRDRGVDYSHIVSQQRKLKVSESSDKGSKIVSRHLHSTASSNNNDKPRSESKLESSVSSGDETCSDTTFIDHTGCPSHVLNSVDPSQASDSNTQETRSISSLGTQMENNNHDHEVSTNSMITSTSNQGNLPLNETQQQQRDNEQVSESLASFQYGVKDDPMPRIQTTGYSLQQSMFPSGTNTSAIPSPLGPSPVPNQNTYTTVPSYPPPPPPPPPPSRAGSVASCFHRSPTPGYGVEMYSSVPMRSYSLDGGMNFQQSVNGLPSAPGTIPYPSSFYPDYIEIQDPSSGVFCSTQSGQYSDYPITSDLTLQTQGSLPPFSTVNGNSSSGDHGRLDGFAHFALIKDLLD